MYIEENIIAITILTMAIAITSCGCSNNNMNNLLYGII